MLLENFPESKARYNEGGGGGSWLKKVSVCISLDESQRFFMLL